MPFVYATFSIPDVCAEAPAAGYTSSKTCAAPTTTPKGETVQTCCWKERTGTSQAPGSEINYCQTCYSTGGNIGNLNCTPKQQQAAGPLKPELSGTLEEGQVIEGNTTGSNVSQDRLPGGGIFKVPETNLTFSQTDSSNNINNKTLAQLQSDVEDEAKENGAEEEQEESAETEDETGEDE